MQICHYQRLVAEETGRNLDVAPQYLQTSAARQIRARLQMSGGSANAQSFPIYSRPARALEMPNLSVYRH